MRRCCQHPDVGRSYGHKGYDNVYIETMHATGTAYDDYD